MRLDNHLVCWQLQLNNDLFYFLSICHGVTLMCKCKISMCKQIRLELLSSKKKPRDWTFVKLQKKFAKGETSLSWFPQFCAFIWKLIGSSSIWFFYLLYTETYLWLTSSPEVVTNKLFGEIFISASKSANDLITRLIKFEFLFTSYKGFPTVSPAAGAPKQSEFFYLFFLFEY